MSSRRGLWIQCLRMAVNVAPGIEWPSTWPRVSRQYLRQSAHPFNWPVADCRLHGDRRFEHLESQPWPGSAANAERLAAPHHQNAPSRVPKGALRVGAIQTEKSASRIDRLCSLTLAAGQRSQVAAGLALAVGHAAIGGVYPASTQVSGSPPKAQVPPQGGRKRLTLAVMPYVPVPIGGICLLPLGLVDVEQYLFNYSRARSEPSMPARVGARRQ